jgi:hypothetical protein
MRAIPKLIVTLIWIICIIGIIIAAYPYAMEIDRKTQAQARLSVLPLASYTVTPKKATTTEGDAEAVFEIVNTQTGQTYLASPRSMYVLPVPPTTAGR